MPKSPERCKEIREETKAKILKESALFFAKNGFADTKISELAKQIGIAQGTIYIYFKSKEELYDEIRHMVNNDADVEEIRKLSRLPISAKKKIMLLARQVIENLTTDEMYAAKVTLNTQLMMEDSQYDAGSSLYQSNLYRYTAKIIQKGQREGTVVAGDAVELADCFWSVVYVYALKSQFSSHFKMLQEMQLTRILLKDVAKEV